MTKRSEFSKKTKEIIAARSGYCCSFLNCNRPTIGPGNTSNEVATTGVASHIFPASPGGPRGPHDLSDAQLKSPENGIWLCAEHGRIVDANRGDKYPPNLLSSFKALHEAKMAREQQGVFSPMGWFHTFTLEESPIFRPNTQLQFGKLTLILGANATGKTALFEWLVGMADSSVLSRWLSSKNLHLKLRLHYSNPAEQISRLELKTDGVVTHFINGNQYPFHPIPIRLIIVKEPRLSTEYSGLSDFEMICAELNIDPTTIRSLFEHIEKFGTGTIRNIRLVEEDDRACLKADFEGSPPGISFRCWGHSEKTRFLVELAVTAAYFAALYVPTLVIVEGAWRLDERWLRRYVDYLSAPKARFQTVLILGECRYKMHWSGWTVATLERTDAGSVIQQD